LRTAAVVAFSSVTAGVPGGTPPPRLAAEKLAEQVGIGMGELQ